MSNPKGDCPHCGNVIGEVMCHKALTRERDAYKSALEEIEAGLESAWSPEGIAMTVLKRFEESR